jgi:hypothetical protein
MNIREKGQKENWESSKEPISASKDSMTFPKGRNLIDQG